MPETLYDGTIVVAYSILKTLSHILHRAEEHPNGGALLEARLYEDMYPLTDQVRLATQFSENLVARLTGRAPVTFERDLTTFAKCYERIETVQKTLQEADKDVVNHHGDVIAPAPLGPKGTIDISGARFAYSLTLPNIYFHLCTAYGILRNAGVPLGKMDYYAGFFPPPLVGDQ